LKILIPYFTAGHGFGNLLAAFSIINDMHIRGYTEIVVVDPDLWKGKVKII